MWLEAKIFSNYSSNMARTGNLIPSLPLRNYLWPVIKLSFAPQFHAPLEHSDVTDIVPGTNISVGAVMSSQSESAKKLSAISEPPLHKSSGFQCNVSSLHCAKVEDNLDKWRSPSSVKWEDKLRGKNVLIVFWTSSLSLTVRQINNWGFWRRDQN